MRDANQILNKVAFVDPIDKQWKLRNVVDMSYVTTVEGPESLYRENENDATRWIYRDGFGIRRKYWYPGQVPVIGNVVPETATYTINYQEGLVVFSEALTDIPNISNLQYFEDLIVTGYDLNYNALRTLVLNELSVADTTWREKVFSGEQELSDIVEPWYIVTSHTRLWRLRILSLEFETDEAKTVKVFYSTGNKDFDKSMVWAGIINPTTEKFIDFSGEDPIRFNEGSELKIQISRTIAPCKCWWHILTEERT
jgi:hypothetical protein